MEESPPPRLFSTSFGLGPIVARLPVFAPRTLACPLLPLSTFLSGGIDPPRRLNRAEKKPKPDTVLRGFLITNSRRTKPILHATERAGLRSAPPATIERDQQIGPGEMDRAATESQFDQRTLPPKRAL